LEIIDNLISVLRPYWKSLQYLNDSNPDLGLKEHLDSWNKTYREGVKFYSYENPPSEFALTGFFPLHTDEENKKLDIEINGLIEKTDLSVPLQRICMSLNENKKSELSSATLEKVILLESSLRTVENFDKNILNVVENIAQKKVNKIFFI
jgi:hypothetical protein